MPPEAKGRRHCCEKIVGNFQYLRLGLLCHSRHLPQEEEGEHEIDVSSTNVERDDRAVEEEQNDIAIPEKETSPIVESSPLSPSPDNFIVKSIRYANYNLESMIDRYPNLRGSLTVKSELRKFSKFRMILEKQKLVKFFRSSIFGNYLQLEDRIRFQMSLVYQLLQPNL
ncbi:hypothetical protein H5410_057631 [Solanum commersonii]|uniref:Uncharacterized protein n=1 Tax=Solanum commersonii TaxID=4109 RepID=A0A9J5WNM1_SOLCO|nr:hypothetical protein H5410_057631 [Solanum commersonii]